MSFSWLSVQSGRIVDANNKQVFLRGFNTSGLEYGDGINQYSLARFQALTSLFSINLFRVAINVAWWNNNLSVSNGYQYQDWIKQIIAWCKSVGCYVEIDPTTLFATPTPLQGTSSQDSPSGLTEVQALSAVTSFWNSFIPSYANDPAVLYDALNEPNEAGIFANTVADLNQMINLIQSLNSRSLVFVYADDTDLIAKGQIADYTQENLVWSFHWYDDPNNTWQSKVARNLALTWPYAQAHNHALAVEEWSVFSTQQAPNFATQMAQLALQWGSAITYYYERGPLPNSGSVSSLEGFLLQQCFDLIANNSGQPASRSQTYLGVYT